MEAWKSILETRSFVGGDFVSGLVTHPVLDKYKGQVLADVGLLDAEGVRQIPPLAIKAMNDYKQWNSQKRYDLIGSIIKALSDKSEAFAQLICLEAGKPIDYARAEVSRSLQTLIWAQEESRRIAGEVIPVEMGAGIGKQAMTARFPKGPVFGISPFNFPLNLALHKLGPALACGCPIILKPSPYAPLTLLALGRLLGTLDMPKGLVNIIVCADQEAQLLVQSEDIKVLSFTGSPQVGWELKKIAGDKTVQLELGGNAPLIIDEGSSWRSHLQAIAKGAYLYAGQICISTQRFLVHKNEYEAFKKEILAAIKTLGIGDPGLPQTDIGPLIDPIHLQRVDQWVQEAQQRGAKILVGGSIADQKHNLYQPTLLENPSHDSLVWCEEVFGPVATLESFSHYEEALELANKGPYGLQVGVMTQDVDHMKKAFNSLEFGAVIINGIPGFRLDHMPYGGVKKSGLGREGLKYSIEEFTEPRLMIF